jgi:hypothetical protein
MIAARVLLVGSVVLLAGCSSPQKPENVLTGTVTYDGEPVREGRITLLGRDNRIATTTLKEGSYRIVDPPLGAVSVLVVSYPAPSGGIEGLPVPQQGQALCVVPPMPPVRLPKRYAEPATSGLIVSIAPGEQQVNVSLERHPGDPPAVRAADLPLVGVAEGQTAPDISGTDLDDRPLKLSEHRGKVVALLFWGHW